MSQLLLERLSKKNTKKAKMKPMEIKLEKGQVNVKIQLVKSDAGYDIESFNGKESGYRPRHCIRRRCKRTNVFCNFAG